MGVFKRIDPSTAELAKRAAKAYENKSVEEIKALMDDLVIRKQFMEIFEQLFKAVGSGEEVAIETMDKKLSSQEAANFLQVSRPHVVQLIDSGAIPAHNTGSHRRVLLKDLIEYKNERERKIKALDILSEDNANYEDGLS